MTASRVDALIAHDWADDWDSLPDAPDLVPAEYARRLTRDKRAEIVSHAAEHGVTAAAEQFGVSQTSVKDWRRGRHLSTPDPAPRQRQRRSRAQTRRDEIRLFKRRLAAKGKAASELYAATERLQDLLAQARAEETDPRSLAEYRKATSLYHEMRDSIVRAVMGGKR